MIGNKAIVLLIGKQDFNNNAPCFEIRELELGDSTLLGATENADKALGKLIAEHYQKEIQIASR